MSSVLVLIPVDATLKKYFWVPNASWLGVLGLVQVVGPAQIPSVSRGPEKDKAVYYIQTGSEPNTPSLPLLLVASHDHFCVHRNYDCEAVPIVPVDMALQWSQDEEEAAQAPSE